MEHTDKDQTEISRDVSRPSSKTIAMSLPEILHNVLTFLDKPSLTACLQVSRFWYTHGRILAWQTLSLPLLRFLDLASNLNTEGDKGGDNADDDKGKDKNENDKVNESDEENDKNKENNNDSLQYFIDNCRHIRSLTLTEPKIRGWVRILILYKLGATAVGLGNLVHLAVHFPSTWDSQVFYYLAGAVLAQNPGIQELELHASNGYYEQDIVDLVLKKTSKRLKKLSISGNFSGARLQFFEYLIKANEKRHKQQPQQPQQGQEGQGGQEGRMAHGLLMDESVKDETSKNGDGQDSDIDDDHAFKLEELVLRDIHGYRTIDYNRTKLDLQWLYCFPGELHIRTLTMLNFDTCPLENYPEYDGDNYDEIEEYELNGSILSILERCPRLEKLCVSFDLHPSLPINSSRSFLQNIRSDPHYTYSSKSVPYMKREQDYFVQEMFKRCPKLREIELGMFYQLTKRHWTDMIQKYGKNLDSLAIWGDVVACDSDAFRTFIDPFVSCAPKDGIFRLSRLNINGMTHLHKCAPMLLYELPHLKEFRAKDVPLDARQLIKEGGWICKGLEVLEILIWIPKEIQPCCSLHKGWVNDSTCRQDNVSASKKPREEKDKNEGEGDQRNAKGGSKRPLKESVEVGPQKRAKTFSEEHKQTQIKVCEALGHLTRLRELRIEGQRDFESEKKYWGCLELTLETGLDCLAPLQALEKLIVPRLDEGLSGKKEVEWMARNWIHSNNHRWLEQHDPARISEARPTSSSQSMEEPQTSKTPGLRSDDDGPFFPYPIFKELIGVTMDDDDAVSNISWLQEQCPTLSVIKICH